MGNIALEAMDDSPLSRCDDDGGWAEDTDFKLMEVAAAESLFAEDIVDLDAKLASAAAAQRARRWFSRNWAIVEHALANVSSSSLIDAIRRSNSRDVVDVEAAW